MNRGDTDQEHSLFENISNTMRKPLGMLAVTAALIAAAPSIEPAFAADKTETHPIALPRHTETANEPGEDDGLLPSNGVLYGVAGGLAVLLGVTLKEMLKPSDKNRRDS